MSTRVRFAPSPTGSLHLGSALSAVANRRRGDWLLLRIDDTDPAREVDGRRSRRSLERPRLARDRAGTRARCARASGVERYREAARALGAADDDGALRFGGTTLLRADGTPTYQLASVVDDLDFGITHVVRGSDHRANDGAAARALARARRRAARVRPPRPAARRGRQEALQARPARRRSPSCATRASPPRPCAPTSRSSACPRTTSTSTAPRIRRLAIDAIEALSDEELAARAGAPPSSPARCAARATSSRRARWRRRSSSRSPSRCRRRPRRRCGASPSSRAAGARRAREHRARGEGGRRRPEGAAARADRAPSAAPSCGR